MREQGCWFYNESSSVKNEGGITIPTANFIRKSMGDLSSISVVAKHAARLAQGFSSTTSPIVINDAAIDYIPDVQRNGYYFSDGVGMISSRLANTICKVMNLDNVPSAVQIRFRGAKGMVSVNKELDKGRIDLCLRQSMVKFEGNPQHNSLEICSVAKRLPFYLNRQVITLLSALKVPDRYFMNLLQKQIQEINDALHDSSSALKLCRYHTSSHSTMRVMLESGCDVKKDRFLAEMVEALRNHLLLGLVKKARIFVPEAVSLVGIMDETNTLEENSVYIGSTLLLEGTRVAVGRNPSLHPGDIRILTIVTPPSLLYLNDVIVFSSKGDRPQGNKMSGGDLDGDLYFIIWDTDIVSRLQVYPPMEYEAPPPPPSTNNVTTTAIADFFVNYMKNDNLGRIANAHIVFADMSEAGALCGNCLKLAELHSAAVDFAKTGVPAVVDKSLSVKMFPDFMENTFKPSYESSKVLGSIYRYAKGVSYDRENNRNHNNNGFDSRLLLRGHEKYIEEAWYLHHSYMSDLWAISNQFEVSNEAEMITGYVRSFSRKVARHREGHDAGARLLLALRELQGYYWGEFTKDLLLMGENQDQGGDNADIEGYEWEEMCKAAAWYFVAYTYRDNSNYAPYLSFGWIAIKPMCKLLEMVNKT